MGFDRDKRTDWHRETDHPFASNDSLGSHAGGGLQ